MPGSSSRWPCRLHLCRRAAPTTRLHTAHAGPCQRLPAPTLPTLSLLLLQDGEWRRRPAAPPVAEDAGGAVQHQDAGRGRGGRAPHAGALRCAMPRGRQQPRRCAATPARPPSELQLCSDAAHSAAHGPNPPTHKHTHPLTHPPPVIFLNLQQVIRVVLEWQELNYQVPVGRRRKRSMRTILQDQSAALGPGRLLAVMGACRDRSACLRTCCACTFAHSLCCSSRHCLVGRGLCLARPCNLCRAMPSRAALAQLVVDGFRGLQDPQFPCTTSPTSPPTHMLSLTSAYPPPTHPHNNPLRRPHGVRQDQPAERPGGAAAGGRHPGGQRAGERHPPGAWIPHHHGLCDAGR